MSHLPRTLLLIVSIMTFLGCDSDSPVGNDRKLEGHLRITALEIYEDGRTGGMRTLDTASGVMIYLEKESAPNTYVRIDSTTTAAGSFSFNQVDDGSYRVHTWIPADSAITFTFDATTTSIDTLILGSTEFGTRPNPFSAGVEIDVMLPTRNNVTMRAISVDGAIDVPIISALLEAGIHTVFWNGLRSDSTAIPTGVYCVVTSTGVDTRYYFGFKE